MSPEEDEIKVQDRRRFLSEAEEAPQQHEPTVQEKPASQASRTRPPSETISEVNFGSFILGLSTQALMCMGEIPDPQTGKPYQDPQGARQLIDILGMLKEKTAGNLGQDEVKLLEHILFDLRMRYVKFTKH